MKRLHNLILLSLSIGFWILIWDLISFLYVKDQSIFPNSKSILENTMQLMFEKNLIWKNLYHSFYRFFISAFISLPFAYALAVISARSKFARWIFEPVISITFPLPKVALFPLIVLLMGIGDASKIFLIGLSIFYLVFINVFQEAKALLLSPMMDLVEIYKVKSFNFWFHYLIKGCWPSFLVGMRTGLGYGITVTVVSELTLSTNGIGFFIWSSWDQYRVLDMYSGILVLGIVGYVLHWSLEKLERLVKKHFV